MKIEFSYANHIDCQRFNIEPNVTTWARSWVQERMDFGQENIVKIQKEERIYFEWYKKAPQPHIFHNLIVQTRDFPFHIHDATFDIAAFNTIKQRFRQFISWDAAVSSINHPERQSFWQCIEKHMEAESVITVAFARIVNLPRKALVYLNEKIFPQRNYFYEGEVGASDFYPRGKIARVIDAAVRNGDFLLNRQLKQDPNYICQSYLELLAPEHANKLVKECPYLKEYRLTFQGIHISF